MSAFIACVLCVFISVHIQDILAMATARSETKILTPEEFSKAISAENSAGGTVLAKEIARGVPPDNGGNYGDLVYRQREKQDRLLLRELVINQQLASVEQDVHWSVSITGARISSVRVLNLGRERAYCLRIDVAGTDAQAIIRIPALYDPRVLIEVYGY